MAPWAHRLPLTLAAAGLVKTKSSLGNPKRPKAFTKFRKAQPKAVRVNP
jgi:hypothetical protein